MVLIERNKLQKEHLPGRIIQKAVGKDGCSVSGKMTMGFGHYSSESGLMEPHYHAEEVVYIIGADKGWFRYGATKVSLGEKIRLEQGMTLHFEELEWHVFEYDEGGYVDIAFFYGQVDHIRPEEILNLKNNSQQA